MWSPPRAGKRFTAAEGATLYRQPGEYSLKGRFIGPNLARQNSEPCQSLGYVTVAFARLRVIREPRTLFNLVKIESRQRHSADIAEAELVLSVQF